MRKRRTQPKSKLNKRLVRQTLRGYKAMNKYTQTEERVWATQLTSQQARALFIELCQAWEQSGARTGGDWEAIERLNTARTIQAQQPFVKLAQRMARR